MKSSFVRMIKDRWMVFEKIPTWQYSSNRWFCHSGGGSVGFCFFCFCCLHRVGKRVKDGVGHERSWHGAYGKGGGDFHSHLVEGETLLLVWFVPRLSPAFTLRHGFSLSFFCLTPVLFLVPLVSDGDQYVCPTRAVLPDTRDSSKQTWRRRCRAKMNRTFIC